MNAKYLIYLILIIFLAGCERAGDDHQLLHPDDVVLVEVDGGPVTLPMLEFLMEAQGVDEEDTEGMRRLLDELIRLRAVANRAADDGISNAPKVRAERMIKDMEVQYIRFMDEYRRENPVSDEEIRAVYDAQVERAGDRRYKLETIEFPGQTAALEQLDALQADQLDFEQAIELATADGRIARRTDWIDASQVPGDFAALLNETEAGDVVKTLLPYENQWLIVRVAELDALAPPAFDEVREGIRRTLVQQQTQAVVDRIFENAEITPMLPLDDAPAELP